MGMATKVEEEPSTSPGTTATGDSEMTDDKPWGWLDGMAEEEMPYPAEWYGGDYTIWVPVPDQESDPKENNVEVKMESVPPAVEAGQQSIPLEHPEEPSAEQWSYGWVWDPVKCIEVPLVAMIGEPCTQKNNSWIAQYQDDCGNSYCVVKPSVDKTKVNAREILGQANRPKEEKIPFEGVHRTNFAKFSAKAWGEKGAPGSMPEPASSSGGEVDQCDSDQQHQVELEMREALGEKPSSNDPAKVLSLETVQGMTVKEHLTHVTWYSSPEAFKEKIPNEISEQLWYELVAIFVAYHVYDEKDPGAIIYHMKETAAHKFLALTFCLSMYDMRSEICYQPY